MKAILCENFGGPKQLVLQEIPSPLIKDDQVLIAIKACGVNFPDNLIIQGKYQFKPELPFSPGGEVAGEIVSIGKNVTYLKKGMRVLALCGWGGFAEEVAVDANRVLPIPDQMNMINAAGTLYNYGTSYYALKQKAAIKPGETVLVLGAAGGVGLAAVELAKKMGAIVIACASTNEKLEICKSKGADFTINYLQEDLKKSVQEITNKKGVDIVYDPVGGTYAEPALRSMAWNGRYLVVGFASGTIPELPFNLALLKGCSIIGVFWGAFAEREQKENQKNLGELVNLLLSSQLKQHHHKIYSLENAAEALQDLLDRKVIGKAIIKIGEWVEKTIEPIPIEASPISDLKETASSTIPVVFKNKSELKNHIGQNLGTTTWLKITQERIQQFADATLDFQWVHLDTEKAKTFLPGGKTIAHGYLTMSLASQFFYQLISIENINSFVNYGINKARFISPVQVDSEIRMTASITQVEELPNGSTKLFLNCSIEIKGQEKPAYVAEIISMIF
ncbi:MAG: zinc-binding dehydrogenase [Bacteroidetes bacterium]|nr:zinc-binding dehydrogenase [Bacteroidota bacterium]